MSDTTTRRSGSVTPLERLLAEEIPTGEIRDYDRRRQPVTPEEAAAHRAALIQAIYRRKPRRPARADAA